MKQTDYSQYILPVGALVIVYLVLKRVGLVKDTGQEQRQEEQLFKDYFSPTYLQRMYQTGGRIQLLTQTNVRQIAKDLYDSKGVFNDDEQKLYGTIKRFKFKSQVSQAADVFFTTYKKDLASYLSTFLNDQELQRIYNYLDQLPSGKS